MVGKLQVHAISLNWFVEKIFVLTLFMPSTNQRSQPLKCGLIVAYSNYRPVKFPPPQVVSQLRSRLKNHKAKLESSPIHQKSDNIGGDKFSAQKNWQKKLRRQYSADKCKPNGFRVLSLKFVWTPRTLAFLDVWVLPPHLSKITKQSSPPLHSVAPVIVWSHY